MKSRLIRILAVLIGIAGLVIIAIPLAIFDAWCQAEQLIKRLRGA